MPGFLMKIKGSLEPDILADLEAIGCVRDKGTRGEFLRLELPEDDFRFHVEELDTEVHSNKYALYFNGIQIAYGDPSGFSDYTNWISPKCLGTVTK